MAEVTVLAEMHPPELSDGTVRNDQHRQAEEQPVQLARQQPAIAEPAQDTNCGIKDRRYMDRLKRVRALQDFLLAETVKVANADAYLPGDLNLFVYQLDGGRMPSQKDWRDLESCTQTLFSYLDVDLRRKFLLGQAPRLIAWLPVGLLALALASLLGALYFRLPPFICYLVWMISLGAIGAVAFISVNTLSIQTTATFDINNKRLIMVRVVLGALFAVVLSIAFGYPSFVLFLSQVAPAAAASTATVPAATAAAATAAATALNGTALVQHSLLLLLPFLLGFSTTLVIAVLNRLVESAGIFFGVQAAPVSGANGAGVHAGGGGTGAFAGSSGVGASDAASRPANGATEAGKKQ